MIRRALILSFFIFSLALAARAATVTVASAQVSDVNFTTCSVRIWATGGSFFTSAGTQVVGGAKGSTQVYKIVSCSVVSRVATISTFQIDSTTDSLDRASSARYTAVVYDGQGREQFVYMADFRVPATQSPTDWASIRAFNLSNPEAPPDTYLTASQTDARINAALSVGNPATATTLGRVKMSVAPADATSPVAVGDNDPRLAQQLVVDPSNPIYGAVCDGSTNDTAAFQAAFNAARDAGGILLIPQSTNGCLVGGAGVSNYIFHATKPVTITGKGARSILVVADATPSTVDLFRITPPVSTAPEALYNNPSGQQQSGYIFRDFTAVGQSDGGFGNTEPGTKGGRDMIRVDVTAAGSYFQGLRLDNVHLGYSNGRSVSFLNKVSGSCVNTDGIFSSSLTRSTFYEGIYAECFGDSNRITDNRFRGFKSGLTITEFVSGAGNLVFSENNMTADGGVSITGGDGNAVLYNFFELYKSGASGVSGTIVYVNASNFISFTGNLFGIVGSASGTTKGLTIANSAGPSVKGNNRFLINPGVCNIDLAAVTDADIGNDNFFTHVAGSVCTSPTANAATLGSYAGGKQVSIGDLFGAKYGMVSIYSGFTGENNSVLEIKNNIAAKSLVSLVNTQPNAYTEFGGLYFSNTSATGSDDNTARIVVTNGVTADSSILAFRTRVAGADAFRWQIDEDGTWFSANSTVKLGDPGAKPACAVALRGKIWHDFGGAGVADTVEICAKRSDDTYAWVALATVP